MKSGSQIPGRSCDAIYKVSRCPYHQGRHARLKPGIHRVLGQAPKRYASRFFQLKVGHGVVGVFLEGIGVVETAEFWWCGQAESVVQLTQNAGNGEKKEEFSSESLEGWE